MKTQDLNLLPVIPDEPAQTRATFRSAETGAALLRQALSNRDLSGAGYFLAKMTELGFAQDATRTLVGRLSGAGYDADSKIWDSPGPGEPSFGLLVLKTARQLPELTAQFREASWALVLNTLCEKKQWGQIASLANDGVRPEPLVVELLLTEGRVPVLEKFAAKHPDLLATVLTDPTVLVAARTAEGLAYVMNSRPEFTPTAGTVKDCLDVGNVEGARLLVEEYGAKFPRNELTNQPELSHLLFANATSPENREFVQRQVLPAVAGYLTTGLAGVQDTNMLNAWLDAAGPGYALLPPGCGGDDHRDITRAVQALSAGDDGESMLRVLKARLGLAHGFVGRHLGHSQDPDRAHERTLKLSEGDLRQLRVFGVDKAFPGYGLNDWVACMEPGTAQQVVASAAAQGLTIEPANFNLAKSLLATTFWGHEHANPVKPASRTVLIHPEMAHHKFSDKTDDGYTATEIMLLLQTAPPSGEALIAMRSALRPTMAGKPLLEWLADGRHRPAGMAPLAGNWLSWATLPLALGLDLGGVSAKGQSLLEIAQLSRGTLAWLEPTLTDIKKAGTPSAIAALLNTRNSQGNTALHLLASDVNNGNSPGFEGGNLTGLIALGADPLLRNKAGQTPWDLANATAEAAPPVNKRNVTLRSLHYKAAQDLALKEQGFEGSITAKIRGMSAKGATLQVQYYLERAGRPDLPVSDVVRAVVNAKDTHLPGGPPSDRTALVLRANPAKLPAGLSEAATRSALLEQARYTAERLLSGLDNDRRKRLGVAVAEKDSRLANAAQWDQKIATRLQEDARAAR